MSSARSVSAWQVDRSRYGKGAWLVQPSFWAVAVYRFGRWTMNAPLPVRGVAHALYFAAYSVVRLLTGIEIPRGANIGPGLLIHHFGGIVIHPQAQVGARCTMRQGVTLGTRHESGYPPRLGSDVTLGAYAQVLGNISVGDGVTIGAMAVVLTDISPGRTAVGNPARVLPSSPRNESAMPDRPTAA